MQTSSMEDNLEQENHAFTDELAKHFGTDDFRIYSLAGDASARRYYRVMKDEDSWVLMQWEPFDPDSYPFLSVLSHFAKHGVDVPNVEMMWPNQGLILLEDLGDLTLERKFWESQNQELTLPFYKMAVEQLARIHYPASFNKTNCVAFQVEFDRDKLVWEMNYARKNLLEGLLKYKLSKKASEELDSVFDEIGTRLAAEPKYIAHRDYHSRNLMITQDDLRVIDFQDARLGPVQYDLVSLFKDSYVNLEEDIVDELMKFYLELRKDYGAPATSMDEFNEIYELQSVQRCFKACGSFASFNVMRGDKRYLKYIPGTVRRVLKSLAHFPEYKSLTDSMIDSGAMDYYAL